MDGILSCRSALFDDVALDAVKIRGMDECFFTRFESLVSGVAIQIGDVRMSLLDQILSCEPANSFVVRADTIAEVAVLFCELLPILAL